MGEFNSMTYFVLPHIQNPFQSDSNVESQFDVTYLNGAIITIKPLTMDTSAREAMKDAAKCDKHCELQISANQ